MSDRSLTDLSDRLNLIDARHELVRAEAAGEAALGAWARKWGRAAIEQIEHGRCAECPFYDNDED